ncbi:MAG TPA: glycerate kinase, partial [Elusimicrobiales bacterium]|nr:glycerate kinase [Elusimicrobiales bacterium]
MKVLIAPNAFKGTLSPAAGARAMATVARRLGLKAVSLPIADGGDGLIEVLRCKYGGELKHRVVKNALGRPVQAEFLLLKRGRVAVIEMARASGLAALGGERNKPLAATSFGTGQLIGAALNAGARTIIVGLGGSACNDAGTGMASALGVKFYDRTGRELAVGVGPLAGLCSVDFSGLDTRISRARILAFCDVKNPLLGRCGSARVYGPQKGASPKQVRLMEKSLSRLCAVLKKEHGVDVARKPGGGAAGGLAAGLVAFLGAEIRNGAEEVLKLLEAEQMVKKADLVLTGEGKLDSQTRYGKAP